MPLEPYPPKRLFPTRKSLLLVLATVFGYLSSTQAQTPVIQWQRSLGSFNGDYVQMIKPTSDGGFIASGYTEGPDGDVVGFHGNPGIDDIWVVKLDANGTMQWQRSLGGTYSEYGADILQTPDGGYMVLGSSSSVDCGFTGNHGGLDIWLVKLSASGDILWQQLYGGSINEYGQAISPAADGGYFIGGYTSSGDGQVTGYHNTGNYSFDAWVLKVDAAGKLLWEQAFGGSGDADQCFSIQATPDGGCIAAGGTNSSDGDFSGNHGRSDAWVAKFTGRSRLRHPHLA